jgi:hypothetical protein
MGTASDWAWVTLCGLGFAVGVFLIERSNRNKTGSLTPPPLLNVLALGFCGLFVGVGITFNARAFHRPLIGVLGAALVGLVITSWLLRRARRAQSEH